MTQMDLAWSDSPGVETGTLWRTHRGGETIEIPVACITGSRPGPTFAVTSGMHAGEYAGILAAQRLVQEVKPEELSGRLIVVPVISTRAFMMRSMQLSPVDDKEAHFCTHGNPEGSYTDLLIDSLFSIVESADFLIDLHAGEFAQALLPWVPVPMVGPAELQEASRRLALGFRVPYIELRSDPQSIPSLCIAFADAGIANIWVECGKNGIPTTHDIDVHYDGVIAAMQSVGMLAGEPARPEQIRLDGRRHQVNASRSGVWRPAVNEGDIVERGQPLGELTDYFGQSIERYTAPERLSCCTTGRALPSTMSGGRTATIGTRASSASSPWKTADEPSSLAALPGVPGPRPHGPPGGLRARHRWWSVGEDSAHGGRCLDRRSYQGAVRRSLLRLCRLPEQGPGGYHTGIEARRGCRNVCASSALSKTSKPPPKTTS